MKGGLWSTSKAEWLEQIKKYIEMPGRPSDFTFALEDPKFIVDDHLATMVALVPTAFRNSKGKAHQRRDALYLCVSQGEGERDAVTSPLVGSRHAGIGRPVTLS